MNRTVLETLVDLGNRRRVAALSYRRGIATSPTDRRVVEPYSITRGEQDMMLRCYQLAPERGWRFFMLHRIDDVTDGGADFKPRRRVTLGTDDAAPEVANPWPADLRTYRDLVHDSLADGRVTTEERLGLEKFASEHDLTLEDIRFVHASIFHRCLGAILEDGRVEDEELAQLRFLHRALHALGWSVTDG